MLRTITLLRLTVPFGVLWSGDFTNHMGAGQV